MGDDIPRTVAMLHNVARPNGICYVVVYRLAEEDEIRCSFNVTGGFCSNFFAAVVWYWVQMNFKTHAEWEEQVLPHASRKHKTYCTDQEKVDRAKTLLESIWKQQDFAKHKFMVVYAELSERETVLFEECTEQDAPPAVYNTVKQIKQERVAYFYYCYYYGQCSAHNSCHFCVDLMFEITRSESVEDMVSLAFAK